METPAATSGGGGGGGGGLGYADSVDSSPRSRGGDPWDDPPLPAPGRLRLMCSFGGRIFPRPTDKSLCYLGGETRMVVVDRHASLAELSAKLSRTLTGGRPFTLKYQLPNEDLDSLISIATDEDLENMIEEYDRVLSAASVCPGGGSTRSSRLRLFLFHSKPDTSPTSSIGSLLDDSKSETWFVDALNSAMGGMGIDGIPRGMSSESASVNCLLGLEDDSSVHSHGGVTAIASSGLGVGAPQSERAEQLVLHRPGSSGKLARQGQDVHSVPDSPMLDTTSSFGSASSVPSLSNLPPIRVRTDDRPSDPRIAGLDENFAHMNLSSAPTAGSGEQRLDDDFKEPSGVTRPRVPPPIPLSASSTSIMSIAPSEHPSRSFSSDDEKPVLQPPKPTQIEAFIPDLGSSRSMYSNATSDPIRKLPVPSDPSYRIPVAATDAAGYQLQLPLVQPEQFQDQQFHPQLLIQQQQQQQQYIPVNSYYIQHPSTGSVIPVPPYFHVASQTIQQPPQAHRHTPQVPMYIYPVHENPSYNLGGVQPGPGAPNSIPSVGAMAAPQVAMKPDVPATLNRAAAPPPSATVQPPLIHIGVDQAHAYAAGMGYHVVQQHHPSQSPATIANYGYQFAVTDNTGPQVYYSQATLSTAPQGQPVNSVVPADSKLARAS